MSEEKYEGIWARATDQQVPMRDLTIETLEEAFEKAWKVQHEEGRPKRVVTPQQYAELLRQAKEVRP